MTNYIIREDGLPETYRASDDEGVNTEEILKNYPYLVESMQKEEYYIKNKYCFSFDEIIYENKVVGFATLEVHNMTSIVLAECYILPEFRGKGLFYNEICKLNYISPKFGILQPTRKVVELLIRCSLAQTVDNDLVVSAIDFYFDAFDAKSNKRNKIFEDIPPTYIYDMKINSAILVNDSEVIYHKQAKSDEKEYGERKKLTKHYFKNIKKQLKNNKNEYKELKKLMIKNLPNNKMTYEEIVGDGDELTDFMQTVVEDEIITYDEAIEIRDQIIEEYESGEIDDETVEDRLMSILVDEMDDYEDYDENYDDDIEILEKFYEIIGDNEELSEGIINAVRNDDKDKFEELLNKAMDDDEEFNEAFQEFSDELYDDEIYENDLDIDFESFGLNLNSPHPIAEMMWGVNDDKYKLDNTFYGKDYPIDHSNHMFNVLNSLKIHDNLKLALATEDMKGQMTSQAVEMLLHELELINDEVTYENWNEFANESLTVNDLKDFLRKNNHRVSGRKQELIDRIAQNQLPLDEFKTEKTKVTQIGEIFLEEHQWINVYNKILSKFDFNDYSKYLNEHEGEFKEITLNYLEDHLKLAKKENNKEYIDDCNNAKELLPSMEDIWELD